VEEVMLASVCGDWSTVLASLPPPQAARPDARMTPPATEMNSLLGLLLNTEISQYELIRLFADWRERIRCVGALAILFG
jgi:hypothetical protein